MSKTIKKWSMQYQLREVAGCFYLLDMEQPGVPYKRPMELNHIGAQIWQLMVDDHSTEQIVQILADEYEVDTADVKEDVLEFQRSLVTYGVEIGE